MTEPRLATLVVSAREADALNEAVQIYSRNMLFYRVEQPTLLDAFRRGEHLRYAELDNPIDGLIHRLPGVEERDPRLMAALAVAGKR